MGVESEVGKLRQAMGGSGAAVFSPVLYLSHRRGQPAVREDGRVAGHQVAVGVLCPAIGREKAGVGGVTPLQERTPTSGQAGPHLVTFQAMPSAFQVL